MTWAIRESKWLSKGKYPAIAISDNFEDENKALAAAIEASKWTTFGITETSEPEIFASMSKLLWPSHDF